MSAGKYPAYFRTKQELVFIQLSVTRDNSFFNKSFFLRVLVFDVTLMADL